MTKTATHNHNDLQATQFVIALFERSKAQSEAALDSFPGIYAVIDGEGLILKGNRTLAALFAINYENLLGHNFCDLLSIEDREIFISTIDSVKQEGSSSRECKVTLKKKDESTLNYLLDIGALPLDRKDLPKMFSIVGRDVTELTRTTEEKTRMEMELGTARVVQERLFQPSIAKFKGASITGFYEPANECGGDWWHYNMVDDKLFLWIGDVTGHGVPSALVVSAVNAVVSTTGEKNLTPSSALSLLNRAVYATAKNRLGMTFVVASIDLKTKECIYSSAAHEPVILLPGANKEYVVKDLPPLEIDPGTPLGMLEDSKYEERTLKLSAGDRLFFYTDGIREIKSPTGETWKNLKLHRTLASLGTKFRTPQNLAENLKTEIEYFRKGTPLVDDVTFFVFGFDT